MTNLELAKDAVHAAMRPHFQLPQNRQVALRDDVVFIVSLLQVN